jgi:hypothetical protein
MQNAATLLQSLDYCVAKMTERSNNEVIDMSEIRRITKRIILGIRSVEFW